ncbi:MAG: hypothetical protein OEV76_06805 [Anaerolineae bacterium]|nr:hypothetical protein [Anaerolineae bacterium]
MEDMPPAIHEVVAYTGHLEVRGEVRAVPPRRLLDVLNTTQTPYLTIENAAVMPLSRWGQSEPSAAQSVVLNKAEITFVWLIRESRVEVSEFVTVHKVPRQVIAYFGPFVAEGTIHVIREYTLSQALDAIREQFVAITSPSVVCLTVDGLTLKGGIVLCLNKERIVAVQERE